MTLLGHLFGWIAVITHTLFFCLESLWWKHPKALATFRQTPEEAEAKRVLAFNQGFYNLFLAIGLAIGLILQEKILIAFASFFMFGAALVLVYSAPHMKRGALIQGIPPLLTIIFIS